MRIKKGILNTLFALLYEGVALACGLILPRLILSTFGSSYNGIINSLNQFLNCIVLLRAGVAGVTKAALYKPLENKDTVEISRILKATEKFMRRIALIFLVFVLLMACAYPYFVSDEFEYLFSATLILIMGITTFVGYYYGLTYQMLLQADQNQRIIFIVQIITTILNTVVATFLIKVGAGIHLVKLGSAIVLVLNPICINIYVRKKYHLITNVEPNNDVIKQRWDAFAHQVAVFVTTNTDVIILTLLSNIKEVSVYTVYYLVINGLTKLFKNCISGIDAAFGNMMAKREVKLMETNFKLFELVVFSLATIIFIITGIMLVPFVMIYTSGVVDVNYRREAFSLIIVLAAFFGCVRMPYQQVVEAAGHYKQTKNGAFFEAGMNIVVSLLCVWRFGLIGVAFGTLAATIFRTIQYSVYLSKNIIKRSNWYLVKHIVVSAGIAILSLMVYRIIPIKEATNYFVWMQNSIIVAMISILCTCIANICFFSKESKLLIKKFKGILRK